MNPGTDTWKDTLKQMASRVELELCRMIIICCPHRPDERDVIDAASQARPPVRDFNTALAVFPKRDLHGEDRFHHFPVACDKFHQVFLQEWRLEYGSVGG